MDKNIDYILRLNGEVYMIKKQTLINDLRPLLKDRGYKKIRQNWYRDDDDLIIVFNIQNSYYDKDDYYINLGIIIKQIAADGEGICLSNCHLQQRIDAKNDKGEFLTAEKYMRVLDLWEQWYGSLKNLRIRALEGKFPMICSAQAKTFLTMVRLD